MRKKSWSNANKLVSKEYLRRHKKYLKKLRNKKRRRFAKQITNSQEMKSFEKTTDAWVLY